MIKSIILNFNRYKFLMLQLISRDFKVKYKRSILGVLWSLLYPVLMMAVMAIVFTNMFKFKVPGVNYLVYLMSGLVIFNYFNEATNSAMASVVTNFTLINKVYIPKYIFPLSKCLFVGINFLLTLIPLFIITWFTGSGDTECYINIYYLLLPYIFICLFFFTLGIGLILSTVSVFLRDMFYIYGIIITIWNYLTPIFYSLELLPENLRIIFRFNPLFLLIDSTREILLFGRFPGWLELTSIGLIGLVTMLIGVIIFRKNQDKFIYYV